MNLIKIKQRFLNNLNKHGLSDAIFDIAYRGLNSFMFVMALKCVTIDVADPRFLQNDSGYCCEFLDAERLMALSKNPEYQLGRDFLEEALNKGDECFAILDGDFLASYGWYSNKPTKVDDGLELRFDKQYIYICITASLIRAIEARGSTP